MALPVNPRLGPQLVKLARSFHCSSLKYAGSAWRMKHGLPANPSDYGLTTNLPDWSFADGRPAPPMIGQLRRQEKNREIVRRIAQLSSELDHGMKKWEAKMKKQEDNQEEKRRNRLHPKGASLQQLPK
ncbi:large ribosomal subunit protein mL52 isoform X2 [Ahaetulla prasina]|uniref:large ribosomal subunit protein mL52 isoform X1 n=1 Tax=Ahaetulla prasina TaxID=499056 RepID=UPI002648A8D2|nr:large ribosomal subunit protein mL52 isoform X1 [Ahaetulla prasina]XP_058039319.1 large ribosomal subunit protein mL52 isoform X2 [Ahaetulla prasina]